MKMKAASYLMIMIMLVALASLFVLKRPDGKPWLNVSSLTNKVEQQVTELTDQGVTVLDKVKTHTKELVSDDTQQPTSGVQVYRWRDAKGQWHYSDKPNPNGESQHYQLDERKITVIAAEDTSILNKQSEQAVSKEAASALPTALNPKAVKQVMEDAKNIQQLMDDRTKQLEKALEENQR
ncbi:DUF4124 domain-containing protein [Pseudoalteromonas sp. CO348]|uniref:DUF4124 domain-containing protein n=1 Tax=Pseudoalteromonas sp. CO348 TaxID=1777271 RepID=UPI001023C979|nr:DUF4124 domain-containing protein [Pseudoalteromonas sp. CO348]RZG09686.1 DUF4124 domain-containing protein [Pseudoalteromonas sp. CO348]